MPLLEGHLTTYKAVKALKNKIYASGTESQGITGAGIVLIKQETAGLTTHLGSLLRDQKALAAEKEYIRLNLHGSSAELGHVEDTPKAKEMVMEKQYSEVFEGLKDYEARVRKMYHDLWSRIIELNATKLIVRNGRCVLADDNSLRQKSQRRESERNIAAA